MPPLVLFFDFRKRHGLRDRQRQGVAIVGEAWPRFCMSALENFLFLPGSNGGNIVRPHFLCS
jgi:hypothetical protein